MSYEVEYNARSLPADDVARTFVPPEHFSRLTSRNHNLLLGPRGSGKTTLLKMLTLRALANWRHENASTVIRSVAFNAAFIPADIAWGKQIDAFDSQSGSPLRAEAAFVVHSLRALVYAMREAADLGSRRHDEHLSHLAVSLSPSAEEKFVKVAAESLRVPPMLPSLLGLELALESALSRLHDSSDIGEFRVETFASKLSLLISAFNGLTNSDSRRWALLFDELEIAPTRIKAFLLSGIRSIDERIVVKLAIAPYMADAGFEREPSAPQPLHDYHPIQLSYPNKEDAFKFSSDLFFRTLNRLGVEGVALDERLGQGILGGTKRTATTIVKRGLPAEFRTLARKDSSFRAYLELRGLFDPRYVFDENNVAGDIRKVRPIVTIRDYYLKSFEMQTGYVGRSRKSYGLYTGFPSIIEITEGNPRAIMTLVSTLAQNFLALSGETGVISESIQTQAIRRVELLLTSLLQVIPLDLGGFERGKGLLDFVDQVGRTLERRLLMKPFAADYVGSFFLDDGISPAVMAAVGRALNAGAIVHVPHAEGGSDSLLRGLKNQRFRLSYALSPRYRLLLTLGDRVALSSLIREARDDQGQLFE